MRSARLYSAKTMGIAPKESGFALTNSYPSHHQILVDARYLNEVTIKAIVMTQTLFSVFEIDE